MALTIDLNAQQVKVAIDSGTVTVNRFVKAVPVTGGDIHVVQAGLGDPVFGVAHSLVPSTSITDTFNRTNSTTSLGTASDGGTWTVMAGTLGISSNKGYIATADTTAWVNGARRDMASAVGDVSVDISRTDFTWHTFTFVSYNPGSVGTSGATDSGYYVRWTGSTSADVIRRESGGINRLVASGVTMTAPGSGVTTRVRLVHDGSGNLTLYQDGVLIGTYADTFGSPLTGTWVGFGIDRRQTTSTVFWDNFTATSDLTPGTVIVDRSFPTWHQVTSGTTLSAGIPIMSDADGKAVAWDADPHTVVGTLVSAVTTAGNLATIDSSTAGSQSVGGSPTPPLAAAQHPRCYYSTTMSIPNSTHDATVFPQFNWVEWGSTGFHPFDLTDPKNPIVVEAGVYAVTVWIAPGTGTSYFTSTIVTGAGMWGHLQLDATGNVAVTAQSASLAAANTNGSAAGITLSNTVYLPAGAVNRLYFSHNATDPSNFTMYATVQKLT